MKSDDPKKQSFALKPWKAIRRALEDGEEVTLNPEDTAKLFLGGRSVDVREEQVRRYRTDAGGGAPILLRVSHVREYREAAKMTTEDLAAASYLPASVLAKIEDGQQASADQRANIVAALGFGLTDDNVFPPDTSGAPPVKRDALISSGEAQAPEMASRPSAALEEFAAARLQADLVPLKKRLAIAELKDQVRELGERLGSKRHVSQMHLTDAQYEAEQQDLRDAAHRTRGG